MRSVWLTKKFYNKIFFKMAKAHVNRIIFLRVREVDNKLAKKMSTCCSSRRDRTKGALAFVRQKKLRIAPVELLRILKINNKSAKKHISSRYVVLN